MTRPARLLVLAVGNPSRGDDALGPLLLQRLHDAAVDRDGEVELLTDFQLQVEHAADLEGRAAVLFVDAARPGVVDAAGIVPLDADERVPVASHALRPQAVLCVAAQLHGRPPPAWQLAIAGERFGLGEALSDAARRNLERALVLALRWLREQRLPELRRA
ncbi:hydrogenase maturation protease [Piscinibacter sakaiensis]|uniref:hydrogenase maturation protease n=1 Tax=Piscinibacter sakaiensis TaxID=1547922 RepID=UPI003AB061D4